jgi:bromodomain-containing protein 8
MSWKVSDKLLLAQAVHHLGEAPPNWVNVSNLMLAHPLIKTPGRLKVAQEAGTTLVRVFGSRECERTWTALMRSNNLVIGGEEEVESSAVILKQRPKEARGLPPKMDRKSQLTLAQILYAERMEELRDSIKKKEEEFKGLIAKIDRLKSAEADSQLQEELAKQVTPATPATQPSSAVASSSKGDQSTSNATRASPASQPQEASAAGQPPSSPTSLRARGRPNRGRAPDTPSEATNASHSRTAERREVPTASEDGEEPTGAEKTEVEGVEAALGGSDSAEHKRDADEQNGLAGSTKGAKRERSHEDATSEAENEEDRVTDSASKTNAREAKRTRSSTINSTTAAAEDVDGASPLSAKKSRPAPLQRRSRRGEPAAETEEGAGADGLDTVATPSRPTATTRRSARQSREASAVEDVSMDEEAADEDGKDAGESPLLPARSGKREGPRRASSSARHSVDSGRDREKDSTKDKNKEREKRRKANEKLLLQIWTEVSAHTHGNLFQNEVKESVSRRFELRSWTNTRRTLTFAVLLLPP